MTGRCCRLRSTRPALALAETHWRRGDLAEDRHKFILQTLKAMIEERSGHPQERDEKANGDTANAFTADSVRADRAARPGRRTLCLAAHSERDEPAGMMHAQILDIRAVSRSRPRPRAPPATRLTTSNSAKPMWSAYPPRLPQRRSKRERASEPARRVRPRACYRL